ncbi:MAG: 5-formyltetrahydrofolate cyclo-ligase [Lentisphaerae bacterium]|nr:5-formyltetrahydrofolate cyclo-ligase [Lentisphaerota bacterium]
MCAPDDTQKRSLRKTVLDRRDGLDREAVRSKSDLIQSTVLQMSQFGEREGVACYLSTGHEVMTDRLIEACWDSGKAVFVPARVPAERLYRLAELRPDTRLVPGPLGVKEPADPEWVAAGEMPGVFLVPGVAFDAGGGRLGHGGGYYDRLLHGEGSTGRAYKVGLAFDCQIVEAVPMQEHDVRMDAVITESRIVGSNQNR